MHISLSGVTTVVSGLSALKSTISLPVHNITRYPDVKFENLAIRPNGQILTTSTAPNASIYQVDPLGILPITRIYTVPNVTSATGIVEGEDDVYYVAYGDVNLKSPLETVPTSYGIIEIDVRGLYVLPNGTLSKEPAVKHIASLPDAALLNGATLAAPNSTSLLIADSFRGLIWNVDICDGTVSVALNDTTTKGPTMTGPGLTGINGIKAYNNTLYWTNTGRSAMYKVPIDDQGNVIAGQVPSLVTANLTCDDFVLDQQGNAFVAGPENILTRVSSAGEKEVIAGTFNSTSSDLGGPSAVKFGKLATDRWSLYVTMNGGIVAEVPGANGVSRIDVGEYGLL